MESGLRRRRGRFATFCAVCRADVARLHSHSAVSRGALRTKFPTHRVRDGKRAKGALSDMGYANIAGCRKASLDRRIPRLRLAATSWDIGRLRQTAGFLLAGRRQHRGMSKGLPGQVVPICCRLSQFILQYCFGRAFCAITPSWNFRCWPPRGLTKAAQPRPDRHRATGLEP